MTLLVPLAADDIAEVMRLERLPGYESFVGTWTAEEHAAALASPDARYLGVRNGDRLSGFVILQDFTAPSVRLRRIVVAEPGRGAGTALLRAVTDWTFQTTAAESLWLHVALQNPRARHVYAREGWAPQGQDDELHERMRLLRVHWRPAA